MLLKEQKQIISPNGKEYQFTVSSNGETNHQVSMDSDSYSHYFLKQILENEKSAPVTKEIFRLVSAKLVLDSLVEIRRTAPKGTASYKRSTRLLRSLADYCYQSQKRVDILHKHILSQNTKNAPVAANMFKQLPEIIENRLKANNFDSVVRRHIGKINSTNVFDNVSLEKQYRQLADTAKERFYLTQIEHQNNSSTSTDYHFNYITKEMKISLDPDIFTRATSLKNYLRMKSVFDQFTISSALKDFSLRKLNKLQQISFKILPDLYKLAYFFALHISRHYTTTKQTSFLKKNIWMFEFIQSLKDTQLYDMLLDDMQYAIYSIEESNRHKGKNKHQEHMFYKDNQYSFPTESEFKESYSIHSAKQKKVSRRYFLFAFLATSGAVPLTSVFGKIIQNENTSDPGLYGSFLSRQDRSILNPLTKLQVLDVGDTVDVSCNISSKFDLGLSRDMELVFIHSVNSFQAAHYRGNNKRILSCDRQSLRSDQPNIMFDIVDPEGNLVEKYRLDWDKKEFVKS